MVMITPYNNAGLAEHCRFFFKNLIARKPVCFVVMRIEAGLVDDDQIGPAPDGLTDHLNGQLYVDIMSRELFDDDDGEETEE